MSNTLTQDLTADPLYACWRIIGTRGDQTCPKLVDVLRCVNCNVYHDTAQILLERLPVTLDEDTSAAEIAPTELGGERFNVLVFRLHGEWLALPTRMLDEVSELRKVHPVPYRRRGALLGLVNVRGTLTPCVSLARLLSLPPDTEDRSTGADSRRMLILKSGASQIAMPVDTVDGIHTIRSQAVAAAPATLSAATHSVSIGVIECGKHRAGLLDATRLLQALTGGIA